MFGCISRVVSMNISSILKYVIKYFGETRRPLCHECEKFNTSTTSENSVEFAYGSLKLQLIDRRWKRDKGKLRLMITTM